MATQLAPYIRISDNAFFPHVEQDILQSLEDPAAARALYDASTVAICDKNVSFYQAWYARDLVVRKFNYNPQREMEFVHKVLTTDTKNYQGWNYRKRMFQLLMSPTGSTWDLSTYNEEVAHIKLFLDLDSKHYNAWEYLQWLHINWPHYSSPEDLLDYVTDVIVLDPFNNSAWNFRFWLLVEQKLVQQDEKGLEEEVHWCCRFLNLGTPNEAVINYLYGVLRSAKASLNREYWGEYLPLKLKEAQTDSLPISQFIIGYVTTPDDEAFAAWQRRCLLNGGLQQ